VEGYESSFSFAGKKGFMKKIVVPFVLVFVSLLTATLLAAEKDFEIQGKRLIFQRPPFRLTLPAEFRFIHSFSHPNPAENSLTRVYFILKTKEKQVEEMLILQIADKTNPQAGLMRVPPLKPYTERRMYSKSKVRKEGVEIDYMVQLMRWNPDAPSLQPIIKKGLLIPPHWALQGQFLFLYQAEHAVFFRYSKDIDSFGIKTSEKGGDWEKGVISGNQKKVYETFQKTFMQMIESIQIKVQ